MRCTMYKLVLRTRAIYFDVTIFSFLIIYHDIEKIFLNANQTFQNFEKCEIRM